MSFGQFGCDDFNRVMVEFEMPDIFEIGESCYFVVIHANDDQGADFIDLDRNFFDAVSV